MLFDIVDVLKLLERLADDDNLRVTVTQSAKGGFFTGIASMLGGLIMGPLGLGVGTYSLLTPANYFSQFQWCARSQHHES